MKTEKVEKLAGGGGVVSEAEGVFENSTTDHETIDFRVFGGEGLDGGEIFDVAVDDEFGSG